MTSLRDLGLSKYEARTYRTLLQTGPTTAKQLSQVSDVPMGRIYDVLNSIEQYNLVRTQTASRPKKYVAVEPRTALDRLLEDKKRELEAEMRRYERMVEELTPQLQRGTSVDEQFWTAAVGHEETIDLLLERIDTANEHIVMIAANQASKPDIETVGEDVLTHFERALDRGVRIDLLMTRELVDALSVSVGETYRTKLQSREDFAVRTNNDLSGTFTIIDSIEACVQVPNPLSSGDAFGMINLKDPEFAANVNEAYLQMWDSSEPLVL